jgi:hypothetical protein
MNKYNYFEVLKKENHFYPKSSLPSQKIKKKKTLSVENKDMFIPFLGSSSTILFGKLIKST